MLNLQRVMLDPSLTRARLVTSEPRLPPQFPSPLHAGIEQIRDYPVKIMLQKLEDNGVLNMNNFTGTCKQSRALPIFDLTLDS